MPATKKKAAQNSKNSPPATRTRRATAAKVVEKPVVQKRATKKEVPKKTVNKTAAANMSTRQAAAAKPAPKKAAASKPARKPAASKKSRTRSEAAKAGANFTVTVTSKKRKAASETEDETDEEEEVSDETEHAPKKRKTVVKKGIKPAAKVVSAPKKLAAVKKEKAPPAKKPVISKPINAVPTQRLDIYVFGEGSSGELGLGSKATNGKSPIDVKRPRLNETLSAETVGVVHIAVGGMHCAAITSDNKILTWGVNDQGALGRDTNWEGGLVDIDDDRSEVSGSDDDTGMNPLESTPGEVDAKCFKEGTKFVQVAATDSATFALAEDGSVYGWGTFRSNEGILGFTEKIFVQYTPMMIPELKKIVHLAAGGNHMLALDQKGNVFAWGSGQQNQLGRRVVERTRFGALVPREFGLPKNKIEKIACGAYHSFAIDKAGKVYAWGLNNYCETAVSDGAGEDNAIIPNPTVVTQFSEYKIKQIVGGAHHSLACTEDGKLLVWGRADASQCGVDLDTVPKESFIYDDNNNPRIIKRPTIIPNIQADSVAAGSDQSFAVDVEGRAYSWGFSGNYQTGQGTSDDVEVATLVENTAVKGKKILGALAGGQFGILYSAAA